MSDDLIAVHKLFGYTHMQHRTVPTRHGLEMQFRLIKHLMRADGAYYVEETEWESGGTICYDTNDTITIEA